MPSEAWREFRTTWLRAMLDLWYKNAVVYSVDVDTFCDGNGDGIGDFQGLVSKLDYLASLNITCIWLLPLYPSPNRDNGYDVLDFYGVDDRLGSLGDFVEFTRQARERGLRVLADLVVNHTSIDHPWFQQARADRRSPFREFYIWSDVKPARADEGMVFPGEQESTWSYDEQAGAWYFHRFFAHQPDLNVANLRVRDEISKIMSFWLSSASPGSGSTPSRFSSSSAASMQPRETLSRSCASSVAICRGVRVTP